MKQNNFDFIKEVIGQGYIDAGKVNNETLDLLSRFMYLAEDSYVLIQWPESQMLMEEEWFEEEAILDAECKFGSSAYFVPLKRIL